MNWWLMLCAIFAHLVNWLHLDSGWWYLPTWLILGNFKWTALGAGLFGVGLLVANLATRLLKIRRSFVRVILGAILVILFVWFGHLVIDPQLHAAERWYTTGADEKMVIQK